MQDLQKLETQAVDFVAGLAPWLAPIPTAYLVGRATLLHLAWPVPIAIVGAAIVEALGLASAATALELYQYNQTRHKNEPGAPFPLAAGVVLIYFVVATGLTVALDIAPGLAHYAPAIFPGLSLTGVTVLALRADHRRRLAALADEKAERKAERRAARAEKKAHASNLPESNPLLDLANQTRQAQRAELIGALLDFYQVNPLAGPTEAGRHIGRTRQTVSDYLKELEQAGRIRRNGHGVEVLK